MLESVAGTAAVVSKIAEGEGEGADPLAAIVGLSPAMLEVKATLRSLSRYSINLLLTGPTGTGKSFLSRLYHRLGPRATRPFVEVPCPNIPATLFESELFGHTRGAFTDARSDRRGLIVEANGGTVFLDEITEISPRVQAKLLYVSESRQVRPVGSTGAVDVNVQFVSATNRNLARLVAQGRFRRDLYYRLSGLEITLPPLRDRGEDVLLLGDGFVREFAGLYHRDVHGWDPATESWLLSYAWPGNVRELRETLRIAVLRAQGTRIHRGDLKVWAAGEDDGPDDLRADTILRRHLRRVLEITRGNLTRAGRLLGWERNKVRREARRLGVMLRNGDADDPEPDGTTDELFEDETARPDGGTAGDGSGVAMTRDGAGGAESPPREQPECPETAERVSATS